MEMNGIAFHEGAFPFGDPYIDHVTRCDIGYKNYLSLVVAYALTFGSDSLDQQVGDYLVFHFSRHGRKIREKGGEDF